MITLLLNVLMIHLAQNNDFLGTCALVPQTFNNDLGRGTRKVCVLWCKHWWWSSRYLSNKDKRSSMSVFRSWPQLIISRRSDPMSELHFLFYNICHCHCPCDCDFHFHSHFQIKIYVSLCDLVFLSSRVKVRVGEYDASGFNPPETRSHIEYTVSFDFTQISSTSIQH